MQAREGVLPEEVGVDSHPEEEVLVDSHLEKEFWPYYGQCSFGWRLLH